MVTTVIGMFNTDTSKSAKARLRRKPLAMVRRIFLLVRITNNVMFPKVETAQMITRMKASMIALVFGIILMYAYAAATRSPKKNCFVHDVCLMTVTFLRLI